MLVLLGSEVGIVGLMAVVAGHAAGVRGCYHLRKVLRFGGVLLVAAAAQVSDLGQFRNVRRGVVGMLRQWAVAGFAGYMGVFAGGSGFAFFVVTKHTGVLPCEGYRMLADQVERARPVMAILSESLGDNGATDDEKDCQSGQQDQGWPHEMSGIAEQAAQRYPLPGRAFDPSSTDVRGGSGNNITKKAVLSIISAF